MRSSVSSKTMASGTLANSPSKRALCRVSGSKGTSGLLQASPTAEIVTPRVKKCIPDPAPYRSTLDRSGVYELNVKRDSHLVADKDAAGLECRVPSQAEVFAVDLRCCRDCNSGIALGILHR